MTDLLHLAEAYPEISINIKLSDLLDAFRRIAEEIHENYETERAARDGHILIPRAEVLKMLSVNSTTLWRWDKEGYLKAVKQGRKTMYRKRDVDELMGKR